MSDEVAGEGVQGKARQCQQCRTEPVHAAGLCRVHYSRWYYLKNHATAKYKEMVDGGFDRDKVARPRAQG